MIRNYNNVAPPQTLTVAVNDSETTLTMASTAGYPPVPFAIAVERGTPSEEAMLVTAKDATTFTVTRGYDGTNSAAHPIGAQVHHTVVAVDYREAGVVRVSEAERDALAGNDLWSGRVIFNEDSKRVEIAHPSGGWDQILPTGAIIPFGGSSVPAGFLLANGQAVSRSTHSRLFATLGETYGVGDGSTTFNLPDLRQRFPLGKATAGTGATLGEAGGTIDHVHSQPAHTHVAPSHNHSNPTSGTDGSHAHSQGNTGSAGSHSHSNPDTGGASVGSEHGSVYTSGLMAANDIDHNHGSHSHGSHSHSHSHSVSSFSSHGSSHNPPSTSSGGTSSSVSSATPSSYSSPKAHNHTHPQSATASGGSHSHTTPNVYSNGDHSHTQGSTGSAGGDATGSSGGDTTGASNPPYLTVHYLIRT